MRVFRSLKSSCKRISEDWNYVFHKKNSQKLKNIKELNGYDWIEKILKKGSNFLNLERQQEVLTCSLLWLTPIKSWFNYVFQIWLEDVDRI